MTTKAWIWKSLKVVAVSVVVLSVLVIGGVIYMFASMPSCGENSDAVRYSRSLNKQRLEELYFAMKAYSESGIHHIDMNSERPSEFRDLNVAKIRPTRGSIMVEGCFDHYVYLRFRGYEESNYEEPPKITLEWGEGPTAGSETLWIGSKQP